MLKCFQAFSLIIAISFPSVLPLPLFPPDLRSTRHPRNAEHHHILRHPCPGTHTSAKPEGGVEILGWISREEEFGCLGVKIGVEEAGAIEDFGIAAFSNSL